jgi:hypothetical protein
LNHFTVPRVIKHFPSVRVSISRVRKRSRSSFEILEEVVSLHAISGGPSRPAETRWWSNRVSSFNLQDVFASRESSNSSGEGGSPSGLEHLTFPLSPRASTSHHRGPAAASVLSFDKSDKESTRGMQFPP